MASTERAACIQVHRASIFDRGGTRRKGPLSRPSKVTWERLRDGTSEATVRIHASNCEDQVELLESLSTHRHELVIHRGRQRVWEGPLHRITWDSSGVDIVAHDITEYLLNQPLTQTWSSAYPSVETVTDRIDRIIEFEMTNGRNQISEGITVAVPAWEALDPRANVIDHVVIHNFPNEARTSLVTYPFEMSVGEHLESLSRYQGIDYTVVGRSLHIWDVSRSLGRTTQLTEENFLGGIVVSEYGADHAQAAYVLGTPPEDSNVPSYGSALKTENLDYYGPWTTIYTPYSEEGAVSPTQPELNSQAIRNLAGRTPAPSIVRIPDNSGVILSDAITIDDLVPGVQVPLRASFAARKYSQMQKIDRVFVSEAADEGEKILLTLVPISSPDADSELPPSESVVEVPFSLDSAYVLRVRASRLGTSYIVKAAVIHRNVASFPYAVTNQGWQIIGERLEGTSDSFSGNWKADFQYYNSKTVATRQIDNVAPGLRDFTVTVNFGDAGVAIASGTIEM